MRSRIAVSVLSLSVAVLSLVLGGCNGGNINNESDFSSGASLSAENNSSSDGSVPLDKPPVNSDPDSTPSAPEPPKPAVEPTIFTAPDGIPIYTSEITNPLTVTGVRYPLMI